MIPAHEEYVYSLTHIRSFEFATCGEDRTVKIWDGSSLLLLFFYFYYLISSLLYYHYIFKFYFIQDYFYYIYVFSIEKIINNK